MRFIADAMLGRLAKWLRILGFDVLYCPAMEDREVLRISREQDRVILTRDTGLAKRKEAKGVIFITSDDVAEQLREIRGMLRFEDAEPSGRCASCNGALAKVRGKDEIRDAVPDFIYFAAGDFLRCNGCGKIYWEGSHQKRFRQRISGILKVDGEN